MDERRGHWYLITGLILGLAAGLVYSWLISPVHYVETSPDSLRAEFKDDYRSVIAAAYAQDGDIGRAKARLLLLGDADPQQALASQAQRILAQGGSQADARSLAVLAAALAQQLSATPTRPVVRSTVPANNQAPSSPAVSGSPALFTPTLVILPSATSTLTPGMTRVVFTITPSSQPTLTPTRVPTNPSGTPLSSPTPTATQGLPFALSERSQVCDQTAAQPMLQVQVNDAAGNPVPGIEIQVTWPGGQDSFWTGLEPEVSIGFADFQMTAGVTYSIQVADGGQAISGVAPVQCSVSGGQSFWGGWYLLFKQPQP